MTKKIMLIAAEASGDNLGAGLIEALNRKSATPLSYCGVGGHQMRALGIDSPFDISQLSILGMVEGLKAYSRVKARVADTVRLAVKEKPDAVILIDSWGFTLRVANGIRAAMPDIPLIKYVGPQVWATRPGRAKTLAKSVDLLLALHTMDAPYFEREGLKTVVVGNPALNIDFSQTDPKALCKKLGISANAPVLLVMLGSRPSEIKRLWPSFSQTILTLKAKMPDLEVIIPIADTVKAMVSDLIDALCLNVHVTHNEADKLSAMKTAMVALACSGTVTTEIALAGCPMVIAYKVEPLTYFIFKHISPLNYVTLFNIAAQKEVAPEFIQHECNEDNLVKAITERLTNKQNRDNQISEQFKALDLMGRGQRPPSDLAAEAVISHLKL
jgi:lipid-A-disaccharide synthase